jgi:hypothetical protein
MLFFNRRFEDTFDVTTQCAHDADPRKQRRTATLGYQDQGFRRCQPFRRLVLGLG